MPRIWLVLSDKLGDNAQLRSIAEVLPWRCEEKRVLMREPYVLGKPRVRASLHHLDRARSDPLEPPWPDLVITIGRRLSMVALWIKERSQGRTKIVLVGRPRRHLDRFDLIVGSAQYRLPARANVLLHAYPLMRVDEAAVAAAAEEWRSEFALLPRPLTALMVGGRTRALRLDARIARDLARAVGGMVEREGGSLAVTTSRRTPPEAADALAASFPNDVRLHRWTPEAQRNPYRALLGLADRVVVTGDSASMLIEAARLGKPLAIYPLPPSSWLAGWLSGGPLARLERRLHAFGTAGDLLYPLGLVGYSRDLAGLHDRLVQDGLAVRFGDPFPPGGRRAPDERAAIAARIAALMQGN